MTWETYLAEHQPRHQDELLHFLSIPSISSLPSHAGDVQRAAEWVAERLTTAGLEQVQVFPTGGHPVVYGEWLHAPGKLTVTHLRPFRHPASRPAGTLGPSTF